MGSIHVAELDTPESFVIKHIARKIGLNVRVGKAVYNDDTKEWRVPLKAIVPSILKLDDNQYRTFTYRFENLGEAVVFKEKGFQLVDFPKADSIEDNLKIQFGDMTQKIESKLLQVGKQRWGRLSLVKVFLRPLYSIIYTILKDKQMDYSLIHDNKHEQYLRLLIDQEFLEINPYNKNLIRPTNILTGLVNAVTEREKHYDVQSSVEEIVGIVFANAYKFIHDTMKNRAP